MYNAKFVSATGCHLELRETRGGYIAMKTNSQKLIIRYINYAEALDLILDQAAQKHKATEIDIETDRRK